MGVLEFLCDRRFHESFVLPPNPNTGRLTPYRVSYADFGDPQSNAVVLFCGALMGTRLCYSPLDQLARTHNVRIIHPDRPGIGGSDAVDLDKRIQVWLEMVPQLLTHLNVSHVSLASHSGGDIYLLNTILTYPDLLHPVNPYVAFFAPWVHPSHSKVTHMQATELLPAPWIGKFAAIAKFITENVTPLVGTSELLLKGTLRSSVAPPAPISLTPNATRSQAPSTLSPEDTNALELNDPAVVDALRKHVTKFVFAESMDGISADAQLFMRKPRTVQWCSPSLHWSDIDYAVPLLSKIIGEDDRLTGKNRIWTIDAFHAEEDTMLGEKGRQWFDDCWTHDRTSKYPLPVTQELKKTYDYRSEIIKGTDHNFLMDSVFGASELWLQRVREAFPLPVQA